MLSLMVLGACDSPTDKGDPIAFENLVEASHLQIPFVGTEVIRDSTRFNYLWQQYQSPYDEDGKLPPPDIDFDEKMILAVYYGRINSRACGPVNTIEGVYEKSGVIEVHISDFDYADFFPCEAGAYPMQMVLIPISDLPVIFKGDVPVQEDPS